MLDPALPRYVMIPMNYDDGRDAEVRRMRHQHGEWVKWSDVEAHLRAAEARRPALDAAPPRAEPR